MMPLELNSLVLALDALERSLNAERTARGRLDQDIQDAVRAGIIHRFNVAYDQSWKIIQRWLKENRTPDAAEHLFTRKDLFRTAARFQLIRDPLAWSSYGDARNITSHTYDGSYADAVYQQAAAFLADARFLEQQLGAAND